MQDSAKLELEKDEDDLQIQLEIAADETPPEDNNSTDDEDISDASPHDCSGSVSQPSSGTVDLPSSGNVYNPSQSSAISGDSELKGIIFAHFSLLSKLFSGTPDSKPEDVRVDLSRCHLIVSWSSLLPLLSKCQDQDCAEQVLPDNMKISKNGRRRLLIKYLY